MKNDDLMEKVLDKLDGLSSEMKAARTDIGEIKTDIDSLKTDVRRLEVLHEETDSKIDHILEVVSPNSKRITKIQKHEAKQDETLLFHERRIGFLEKKIA